MLTLYINSGLSFICFYIPFAMKINPVRPLKTGESLFLDSTCGVPPNERNHHLYYWIVDVDAFVVFGIAPYTMKKKG